MRSLFEFIFRNPFLDIAILSFVIASRLDEQSEYIGWLVILAFASFGLSVVNGFRKRRLRRGAELGPILGALDWGTECVKHFETTLKRN